MKASPLGLQARFIGAALEQARAGLARAGSTKAREQLERRVARLETLLKLASGSRRA